jgi:hypothetical protein
MKYAFIFSLILLSTNILLRAEDPAAKALKDFELQLLSFKTTPPEYQKKQFQLLLNTALMLANDQDIKHQNPTQTQTPTKQRRIPKKQK